MQQGSAERELSFEGSSSTVVGSQPVSQTSSRKKEREKERQNRLRGKLTSLRFENIVTMRSGVPDFIIPGVLHSVLGSKSQFDARTGRLKNIMPELTVDCCQTFATLSAVLLSSLGRAEMFCNSCNTSTINYLLYISAWLHQLTRTSWPKRGDRPSVSDLNTCLLLHQYFPSKLQADKFLIFFYNQGEQVIELLHEICSSRKRPRETDGRPSCSSVTPADNPVCGYIVVSGDYTVSIFSVEHQHLDPKKDCYSKAWSFYICDSHGTQPWSQDKASVCGVTFGIPSGVLHADDIIPVEKGIEYFANMLFTLLEEHRTVVPRGDSIPYMTWTPITRRRSQFFSGDDLKHVIENHWLPKTLAQPAVAHQAKIHKFNLLPCFWGLQPPKK